MGQLRSFLFEVIQTVALALGIFAIVYLFLLQPHQVDGNSMQPSFQNGEYLLTDKFSYKTGNPRRGDVIVFAAPPAPNKDYIKRIIALPEDKVEIKNGKVFINEQELDEVYLAESSLTDGGQFLPEDKTITLGEGEYFVLGDNRAHSSDSRAWGTVKKGTIVGRAWLVYWPPQKIGIIPHFTYAGL